jgi:deoxyribonuclease-4
VKLGFHVSIADSLDQSFDRARQLGCTAFQIFTRNPRTWRSKPLDKAIIKTFRAKHRTYGIIPVFSHMPYLPNLASPDETIYRKSVDSLLEEVERCRLLGIRYLVTHMGSHVGSGIENGRACIVNALSRALEHDGPMILLENGSGSGSHMGSNLEEIAEIIAAVKSNRVGSCFDTCHAFGAGYNVATQEGLAKTIRKIRDTIGLDRLKLIHLNDSYGDLGSGVDHHDHIGLGKIGEEGFRYILASPLSKKPIVMETPIDKRRSDAENMEKVYELAGINIR